MCNKSFAPPPGSYYPRNSIENEAMRVIMNKSRKIFDNNIPRLPDYIKTDVPGPGYYNITEPNFKVESSLIHENGTFLTASNREASNNSLGKK